MEAVVAVSNDEKKKIMRDIITNVMVLSRLYSVHDAEYRVNYVKSITTNGKTAVNPVIDHNYVSIRRNTWGQVYDSIQQSGACKNVTVDEINAIFDEMSKQYTPATRNKYYIEDDRLVVKELEGSVEVAHQLLIIDFCQSANKARFSFHISLLKETIPGKLDNVDYFLRKEDGHDKD